MKTPWNRLLTATGLLLVCVPLKSSAVVGYVNEVFFVGDNLFENPLLSGDDHLSKLFMTAPDGTMVSLWDPLANAFGTTAVYSQIDSRWENPVTFAAIDFLLSPGTGARLSTATRFTNTFVGTVGSRGGGADPFAPPPPFSGPGGRYLLGDKVPAAESDTDIFMNILGRMPNVGERFTRLDASSQTYISSEYFGAGQWDTVPSLAVGEAGFFDIVPEPSTSVLGLLGLLLIRLCNRRKA